MAKKRQAVIIMTDTTRWDMLNCYRDTGLKTPYLDKMASEGIRFQKAYTCQPVCGPARSAIFTGTFPHTNGSVANSVPLWESMKTVGQRLSDKGIHTAYMGKWHLDGHDYFGNGECPDGWDENYWYDMKCYLDELSDEDKLRSRDPKLCDEGIEESFTYGHRCSERAIDFLSKYNDEDFLLCVSYDEPHHPFLCPEPYASMYKDYVFPNDPSVMDALEGKPDYQKAWSSGAYKNDRSKIQIRSPYFFACQSYVDYEIGRVLEAIEKYTEDPLIIFTSDHGDALQSHSIYGKGPVFYDSVARIPFLVKGGGAGKGVVYEEPVSHLDITPTVMDYLGAKVPEFLEGKSLMPAILDPSQKVNDVVFTEFTRFEVDHDGFGGLEMMRCATDGRYKLSIHLMDMDELYDTKEDPYELKNLINDESYDEIKLRLHDDILEMMNRTRDPFRGWHWENRPWRKEVSRRTWEYTGYTRQREDLDYIEKQRVYETGLVYEQRERIK